MISTQEAFSNMTPFASPMRLIFFNISKEKVLVFLARPRPDWGY
jgi:hypothetical protein